MRLIKSAEEIAFMEKAAAIGDKVVEAIADTMKPGMTEAALFACAYEALFKNGGELGSPLLMLESSNTFASRSALHRERPQNRVLQRGGRDLRRDGHVVLRWVRCFNEQAHRSGRALRRIL